MGLVGTVWPARVSPSQCAIMEVSLVCDKTCTASVQSMILSLLHSYSSPTCLYGLCFTQNYRFVPKIFAFEQYWMVQRLVLKGIASLFSHLFRCIPCGS